MDPILITVLLMATLAVASVLWGADSRGLDPRRPAQAAIQAPTPDRR